MVDRLIQMPLLPGCSFEPGQAEAIPSLTRQPNLDVDRLIEAAKREVYTPACEKPDEVRAKQGG
jgi:hypothetical protein